MGGGPESRCVGRVYGLDGAVARQDTSINYIVAVSWHFTFFHDEHARSNNSQIHSIYKLKYPNYGVNKYEI